MTAAHSDSVYVVNGVAMTKAGLACLMALMLESRADPAEYEPMILQANLWWNHRLPEADLRRALQASDFKIERAM